MDSVLARDRLLMALFLSAIGHLIVVFGPFGPGRAAPDAVVANQPLTVNVAPGGAAVGDAGAGIQGSIRPRPATSIRLQPAATPATGRAGATGHPAHQRHLDGTREEGPAARYLRDWIMQTEAVGNRAYPRALLEADIRGRIVMAVTLDAAGNVLATRILGGSERPALRNAARMLVHEAAPFAPVPPEVLDGRRALVITRTWSFGESTR